MAQWADKVEPLFARLDRAAGGWPGLIRQVVARFIEMRATQAAASLAYYGLFSIFPLTLLLAALTGFFFQGDLAYWQALALIRELFPFSGDLLNQTLSEVMKQRGAISLFSGLGLLWAASGFFNVLAGSINLAWPKVKLRGYLQNRLVALGMVAALFVLLLLSLISSTLVSLLPFVAGQLGQNGMLTKTREWLLFLRFVPMALTFLLFVALYRWVPSKTVAWKPVLAGALLVTLAWEVAKWGFGRYLGSGLAQYQSVYGPLAAIIALMVWTYVSALIALFGAYLVAGLDMRVDQQKMAASPKPNPVRARVYDTHTPIPQEVILPHDGRSSNSGGPARREPQTPKGVHG